MPTQITDDGLEEIAKFQKLKELKLANTKITDAGFRKHLLSKDSLMKLDFTGTAVSSEAVDEWKEAKSGRTAVK